MALPAPRAARRRRRCYVALAVVVPIGLGYVTTHVGRAVVPPNHLGVAYEDVKFTTSDGLELEGWYVPSTNGAAVIAFPGRNGPQTQDAHARPPRLRRAAVRPPRRGQERGRARTRGAGAAARTSRRRSSSSQRRPDVDPDRIGGDRPLRRRRDDARDRRRDRPSSRPSCPRAPARARSPRTWTRRRSAGAGEGAGRSDARLQDRCRSRVSSNQPPPANLKDLAAKIAPPRCC